MMKQVNIIALGAMLALWGCESLDSLAYQPPKAPEFTGVTAVNQALAGAEKISIAPGFGPEDIAVDGRGNLYAGVHDGTFRNGRILRITPDGRRETFHDTKSWVAGMHFDAAGNLIAADMKRGIVSISPGGKLKVLVNRIGDKIARIPNDVDIDDSGVIYFTVTSTKYDFSYDAAVRIILQARPDGGLARFDPRTGKSSVLINGMVFANGTAVSRDASFVLAVETAKYRVLRHWLKGPRKGKTDVFIDNLPGIPNGISRREDGTFWLGFTSKRNSTLDSIQPSPFKKDLVWNMPDFLKPRAQPYGLILLLSEKGEILRGLHDPRGKIVTEAASVTEAGGYLYIGGDNPDYIARYKLKRK